MANLSTNVIKKFKTTNDLHIHVRLGDVTKTPTVAIVIPEGYALQKLGMVGEAMIKVHPKFKEKREKFIRKLDRENTLWKVFALKLGKPFKYALHAVLCPVDRCKSMEEWKQSMELLYNNVLTKADSEKISSIAFPVLGSGNGGAEAEDAINIALNAIVPAKAKYPKWIVIVCQQEEIYDGFVNQLEMRLTEGQPEPISSPVAKPICKSKERTESVAKTDLKVRETNMPSSPMQSPMQFLSSTTPEKECCNDSQSKNPVSQASNSKLENYFLDKRIRNSRRNCDTTGNKQKDSDIQSNPGQSKIQKSMTDIGAETESGDDESSDGGTAGSDLTPLQRSQNTELSESPDEKATKALGTGMQISVEVDFKRGGISKNSAKHRVQGTENLGETPHVNEFNSNKYVTTVVVGNTCKDPTLKSAGPNGEQRKEVDNHRDQDKYVSKVQIKNEHKSLQAKVKDVNDMQRSRFETNDQQVDLGNTEEYTNGQSGSDHKNKRKSKADSKDQHRYKTDLKDQHGSKADLKDRHASKDCLKDQHGSKAGQNDQQGSKADLKDQQGSKAGLKDEHGSKAGLKDQQGSKAGLKDQQRSKAGLQDQQGSKAGLQDQQGSKAGLQDQQGSKAGLKDQQGSKAGLKDQQGSKARPRLQGGYKSEDQCTEQDVVDGGNSKNSQNELKGRQKDKNGAIPKKTTFDTNDKKDNNESFEKNNKDETKEPLASQDQGKKKKRFSLKELLFPKETTDKRDNLKMNKNNGGSLDQSNAQFGQDKRKNIDKTETKVLERSKTRNQRETPDPKTKTTQDDAAKNSNDVTDEDQQCPICMGTIDDPKKLDKCGHVFCRDCIDASFKQFKPVCPNCNMVYGEITGNQPDGNIQVNYSGDSLPGYEQHGTIEIIYFFPDGVQGPNHPSPGMSYKGTTRWAYLPNSKEGKDVLELLKTAFERKLTFTIGRSTTTGKENVVTWNDIHHKTNKFGGPTKYGYPDDTYLNRVRDELKSKGVV